MCTSFLCACVMLLAYQLIILFTYHVPKQIAASLVLIRSPVLLACAEWVNGRFESCIPILSINIYFVVDVAVLVQRFSSSRPPVAATGSTSAGVAAVTAAAGTQRCPNPPRQQLLGLDAVVPRNPFSAASSPPPSLRPQPYPYQHP